MLELFKIVVNKKLWIILKLKPVRNLKRYFSCSSLLFIA